jgi:hypothetical protein
MDAFSFDAKKIKEVFTTSPWLVILTSSSYIDVYFHYSPSLSFSSSFEVTRFLLITGVLILILKVFCIAVHLVMIVIGNLLNHRIIDFIIGKSDFKNYHYDLISESKLTAYALIGNNAIAKQLVDENKKRGTQKELSSVIQAYCCLSVFFNFLLGGTLYQIANTSERLSALMLVLLIILPITYLYCNYKSMVPSRNTGYIDIGHETKKKIEADHQI